MLIFKTPHAKYKATFNYERAGKIIENYCQTQQCNTCPLQQFARRKGAICILFFGRAGICRYRPIALIEIMKTIRSNI